MRLQKVKRKIKIWRQVQGLQQRRKRKRKTDARNVQESRNSYCYNSRFYSSTVSAHVSAIVTWRRPWCERLNWKRVVAMISPMMGLSSHWRDQARIGRQWAWSRGRKQSAGRDAATACEDAKRTAIVLRKMGSLYRMKTVLLKDVVVVATLQSQPRATLNSRRNSET